MKGHVGVDSKERIIHSVEVTSANIHDSHVIADLLHGGETKGKRPVSYAARES